MDYPKSVPNIGLVDGHFVDENPVTGQIGSLIPAAWGDSITQEILNVIKGAGLVPDESNVAQLLQAITSISASDYKRSVRCATTGPIALSGLQTVDGVTVTDGDRVLVKDQANAAQNWIYTAGAGAWVRAQDANESFECTPGHVVPVQSGTANALSAWQLSNTDMPSLGTTSLVFIKVRGKIVAPGAYGKVTVDEQGRVTAGTNPTTLAGHSIADAYTTSQVDALLEQRAVAAGVYSFSTDKTLTGAHRGLVLLDASAGARTITLPAATAALGVMDVILRRVDLTTNALVIAASGTDKILLDTTGSTSGQASTELLFAGDYLCLRNDSVGRWWCVGQAQLPPSIETVITKYSTPGIFTYTVPPLFRSGRRRARVKVTAGGGGGGHVEGNGVAGGGGGGGGMGSSVLDLSGVVSVTVTIGAGGAGRPGGASLAGGAGGASSFGELISSTGGIGGSSPSAGITGTTTGQIVHSVSAADSGTTGSLGHGGGHGGCSKAFNWQVGDPGIGPGGGGAGGAGTSGARGSGAGAPGEILIEVA